MNRTQLLAALDEWIDDLLEARDLLAQESSSHHDTTKKTRKSPKTRKKISAAARKRMSEGQKKRHAKARAAAAQVPITRLPSRREPHRRPHRPHKVESGALTASVPGAPVFVSRPGGTPIRNTPFAELESLLRQAAS